MQRKLKGEMPIVQTALGLVILIILVAVVVMPQVFNPISPSPAASDVVNGTDLAVTKTASFVFHTFVLTNPDTTTSTARLTVTYEINGSTDRAVNLTKNDGTFIASLDGTSPDVIGYAQTNLVSGLNRINYTSNNTGSNITNLNVNYYQAAQSTQQGWDANTVAIWLLFGVGIAIAVLVYIFRLLG